MSPRTCLVALALALMALEGAPAAVSNGTSHDPPRAARATVDPSCKCGMKKTEITDRIVGGVETDINEYPWQAALEYPGGSQFCGGSLITDRHVITAAQCVSNTKPSQVTVVLKEHDLMMPSETRTVTRGVSSITVHNQYNRVAHSNDIAILELDSPVKVSSKLRPVCLPSDPKLNYEGETATVTGWGTTSAGGSSSDVLREVDVPVLSPGACKKETNYSPNEIKNTMLCAGGHGTDACLGDVGGPLVFENAKKRYDLIGIVSWGYGCADDGYPGVYTRVTKFLKWIENNSVNGIYCSAA